MKVDRPALVRKIADAHEQAGKLTLAYRWLTKGTREYPEALFDYAGRAVTFRDYRERLAEVRGRVEPSHAAIVLPLTGEYINTFEGPISLLRPRFEEDPTCDWSRYFVYTQEGIRAFEARSGTELWAEPAPVQSTAELLLARPAAAGVPWSSARSPRRQISGAPPSPALPGSDEPRRPH